MRIAEGNTKRMQNELKTHTTGTVTTVHVQEGATVETGLLLLRCGARPTGLRAGGGTMKTTTGRHPTRAAAPR
ncbi:MAG: hypothetical protein IPI84_08950 [Holophagaceae bacterium]|nr:hypothetical protein [Holophagaceae bacterium]